MFQVRLPSLAGASFHVSVLRKAGKREVDADGGSDLCNALDKGNLGNAQTDGLSKGIPFSPERDEP